MAYFITTLLIIAIIRLILYVAQLEETKVEKTVVKMSKVYILIFIIGSIIFTAGALAYQLFSGEEVAITIILSIIAMLTLLCSICCSSFRIDIQDDNFTYRTSFGRTYTYSYAEVTKLDVNENTVHLVVGKKNFWIDSKALGVDRFINALEVSKRN